MKMGGLGDPTSVCLCCSFLRVLHRKQLQGCQLRWSSLTDYCSQDMTIIIPIFSVSPKYSNALRQKEVVQRTQSLHSQEIGYVALSYECLLSLGKLITFEQPLVSNILHWYGFLYTDTNFGFFLYCIMFLLFFRVLYLCSSLKNVL